MSMPRCRSLPALLVLVFVALIAIFTQISVDHLPYENENDSRCDLAQQDKRCGQLERRANRFGPTFNTARRDYEQHMAFIKRNADLDPESIMAEKVTPAHFCAILESELIPAEELQAIVNHPRLNSLAGAAAQWNLAMAVNRVYKPEYMLECHIGRPAVFTTYQTILDRQNQPFLTECLKIANVLVNAPFDRWAEELIAEKFEETIKAQDLYLLSENDLYSCKEVFRYVSYIVDKMEHQGLAKTQQYQSLAALRAHLQGVFEEIEL